LDVYNLVTTHRQIFLPGYTEPGRTLARVTNDSSSTEFTIDTLHFLPGHTYGICLQAEKAGDGVHSFDEVLVDECSTPSCAHTVVASDLTGTGTCPGPADIISLG